MAKFKSSKNNTISNNKKKKGPKGKKAREKAKLDRQWGEAVTTTVATTKTRNDDDTSTGSRGIRSGGTSSTNKQRMSSNDFTTARPTTTIAATTDTTTTTSSSSSRASLEAAAAAAATDMLLSSLLSDDEDDDAGGDRDAGDDRDGNDDREDDTLQQMSTPFFYTKLIDSIQQQQHQSGAARIASTTSAATKKKATTTSKRRVNDINDDDDDDDTDEYSDDDDDDDNNDVRMDDSEPYTSSKQQLSADTVAMVLPITGIVHTDSNVLQLSTATTTTTMVGENRSNHTENIPVVTKAAVDRFTEKFIHHCNPIVTNDSTTIAKFDSSMITMMKAKTTTTRNDSSSNPNTHQQQQQQLLLPAIPIQDNPNIKVQWSKSLSALPGESYFGPWLIAAKTSAPTANHNNSNDSSSKNNDTVNVTPPPPLAIIPKRQLGSGMESCRHNMTYTGKYTTATTIITAASSSSSSSLSSSRNNHRHPIYLVPTLALPAMTSYADILITTDGMNFGNNNNKNNNYVNQRTAVRHEETTRLDRMGQLHTVAAMHIMNHVLSSRYTIHQHNKKLSKQQQQQQQRQRETDNCTVDDDTIVEWQRDQGYTRPTVLILLPTRNCCHDFVQILLAVLYGSTNNNSNNNIQRDDNDDQGNTPPVSPYGTNVDNIDRFIVEYGPIPDSVTTSMDETLKLSEHRQRVLRQKGTLWNELFGDHRNDDDDYKIGLQINVKKYNTNTNINSNSNSNSNSRKEKATTTTTSTTQTPDTAFQGSVKLYSDFYRSDIIIASPLGLKMAVANKKKHEDDDDDGDENTYSKPNNQGSKHPDSATDFLSSIEICMIGRSDVLLQQNWDHVTDVLKQINHIPKSMNMTDFSRVRPYCLSGQAHLWKQLIICSSHSDPMITSCFKRYGTSQSGVVKISRHYDVEEASLHAVRLSITRQVFQRVPSNAASTFMTAGTDRVQYFCKYLWPEIEKQKQKHTMIFIPSYFDFITLRNVLLKRKQDGIALIDFVSVTEYSRVTEVSRGRARFLQGRKEVMLYTGRAHYFLRHAIKGVRHLIFLGVPEQASFYAEHVNRLNDGLPSSLNDSYGDDSTIQSNGTCLTLYTKYDSYALERIVGTTNCNRMVKGEKSTYYFSS